jgi:hypothetical protein
MPTELSKQNIEHVLYIVQSPHFFLFDECKLEFAGILVIFALSVYEKTSFCIMKSHPFLKFHKFFRTKKILIICKLCINYRISGHSLKTASDDFWVVLAFASENEALSSQREIYFVFSCED